eukprot:10623363-Alexandrium_andersonii.AAC.1
MPERSHLQKDTGTLPRLSVLDGGSSSAPVRKSTPPQHKAGTWKSRFPVFAVSVTAQVPA